MPMKLLARACLLAGLLCIAPGIQAADKGKEPVRIVKLAVADGGVVGPEVETDRGVGWITVGLGETVELRWTTDEHVSLHLHGYNKAARLPKGARARMRLKARQPGRFPLVVKTLVPEVQKDAEEGKAEHPSQHRMPFYLDVRPRQTASQ